MSTVFLVTNPYSHHEMMKLAHWLKFDGLRIHHLITLPTCYIRSCGMLDKRTWAAAKAWVLPIQLSNTIKAC